MIRDNFAYSRSGISEVVVHGHLGPVDEDAQPLAMVEKGAQRPGLARMVRQGGQFRFGLREQALDRLVQLARRRPERRRLTFAAGVVQFKPLPVQAVDRRDPPDPSLAPFLQPRLARRSLDKIAALMTPTVSENRLVPEKANEALVRAVAVADDDRAGQSFGEQLERCLGAAARVDMEASRVAADRGPQPGAA